MYSAEYSGINTLLVGMSDMLLTHGVERVTRGNKCIELPAPIIIKITNPFARYITISERKWKCILPYAESLWIASGRNDMALVGHYCKKLFDFSDDNEYMRAGYGPRVRKYNSYSLDYKMDSFLGSSPQTSGIKYTDQFEYVYQSFKRDSNTRQAIISIGDVVKDCFDQFGDLKNTKDYPCTRSLHFIKNSDGKLDLIAHLRSNDLFWGATCVNIFNYTFMQEYFAQILGLEVGSYYHIVNNLHFYERHSKMAKAIANLGITDDQNYHIYDKKFSDLSSFDSELGRLAGYEEGLRKGLHSNPPDFQDEFFQDWANVFYQFAGYSPGFSNEVLNKILYRKRKKG